MLQMGTQIKKQLSPWAGWKCMAEGKNVFMGKETFEQKLKLFKTLMVDLGKLVGTGQIIMTHGGIAWAKGTRAPKMVSGLVG